MKAYIALGTNIGDRRKNIEDALAALNLDPDVKVTKISNIHETEPVGYLDQDMFLNACCEVETELSPHALLGVCLGIEAAMGRIRQIKNGPRIIDLDLLLYENEKINTPELTLPHPRMYERDFVMIPLKEILED
ncbi:MAG TPA: 2-amino-4-hydroxy-6-hydroxymethyldihydropteridine diphosphokinase [Clostridiales bacterium]|nr:2-amino-4-hydroxy-6-hydroxymethyldihydropteridine diphosphokinase [Clostridiales bacterium]